MGKYFIDLQVVTKVGANGSSNLASDIFPNTSSVTGRLSLLNDLIVDKELHINTADVFISENTGFQVLSNGKLYLDGTPVTDFLGNILGYEGIDLTTSCGTSEWNGISGAADSYIYVDPDCSIDQVNTAIVSSGWVEAGGEIFTNNNGIVLESGGQLDPFVELTIQGAGSGNGTGIKLTDNSDLLEISGNNELSIDGFEYGIDCDNSLIGFKGELYISNNRTGIRLRDSDFSFEQTTTDLGRIENNISRGIDGRNSEIEVVNVLFENNGQIGILNDLGGSGKNVKIEDCVFNNHNQFTVFMNAPSSSSHFGSVIIDNCEFTNGGFLYDIYFSNIGNGNIVNNVINSTGGLSFGATNCPGLEVTENIVTTNTSSSYGASISNCSNLDMECNEFTGTENFGARVFESYHSTIRCNDFFGQESGLLLHGDCDNSTIRTNYFESQGQYSLTFAYSRYDFVVSGKQVENSNDEHQGSRFGTWVAEIRNTDRYERSQFLVGARRDAWGNPIPPGPHNEWAPYDNLNPASGNEWMVSTFLNKEECTQPCNNGFMGEDGLSDNEYDIVYGLHSYNIDGASLDENNLFRIYTRLMENPGTLNDGHAAYIENTFSVDEFYAFEQDMQDLILPSSSEALLLDSLSNSIVVIEDALQQLDTSNVDYDSLALSLESSFISIWNVRQDIYESQSIDSSDISSLTTQLNSLPGTSVFESNKKLYYLAFLDLVSRSLDSVGSSSLQQMEILADQCPYEAGLAVFDARGLLSFIYPETYYVWEDMCPNVQSNDNAQEKLPVHSGDLSVYPTIVVNYTTISFPSSWDLEKDTHITAYDELGRAVLTTSVNQFPQYKLNCHDLTKGIYFLHIDSGENQEWKTIIKQ